jgi:hypothetical protein
MGLRQNKDEGAARPNDRVRVPRRVSPLPSLFLPFGQRSLSAQLRPPLSQPAMAEQPVQKTTGVATGVLSLSSSRQMPDRVVVDLDRVQAMDADGRGCSVGASSSSGSTPASG